MSAPRLGLETTLVERLPGTFVPYEPPGFPDPKLLLLNRGLAGDLGLSLDTLQEHGAAWFSGTTLPPDATPVALAYGGHQFGHFAGQLGDGRACLLGELVAPDGRRRDLQLKGSGATPFSRGGDGRAVLGPVLREYLMGEAMHALGVPTTRALAVVTTGDEVWRQGMKPGAVLTRVAASHLRVGTLELFAAKRDQETLGRLVLYALERHHPDAEPADRPAEALLFAVADAQARLIARWLAVGFVHGVMNTDNSTLSGETIDYGPCAFMDRYDPETVYSSIDHHGRYAYGNQATIGLWNLARTAEALLPLLSSDAETAVSIGRSALDRFTETHQAAWLGAMTAKLGLREVRPGDEELVSELLAWMREDGLDWTQTFRALSSTLRGDLPWCSRRFASWHARWLQRLDGDGEASARMDAVNPVYIPRNHLVEEALEAATAGELGPFHTLLARVTDPYRTAPGSDRFAEPAPAAFDRGYQTFCGT